MSAAKALNLHDMELLDDFNSKKNKVSHSASFFKATLYLSIKTRA
jgi:hypothetical protein